MPEIVSVAVVVGRFEALVGRGLVNVLGTDPRLRVLDSDLEEAALERVIAQQRPQVAILGEEVDYTLLTRLTTSQSLTGVLVLAHAPGRLCGTMLLDIGVSCLPRNASDSDLLTTVQLAAHGKPTFLCTDGTRIEPGTSRLTSRETEVLELLARHYTNAAIAGALQISIETVRTHVRSVLQKYNVQSRRDLAGVRAPTRTTKIGR